MMICYNLVMMRFIFVEKIGQITVPSGLRGGLRESVQNTGDSGV